MPFAEMWMDLEIIVTGEVSQKKILYNIAAFLVVQMVKNLPAMQETWIRSLGQEDLLKKGMATHSSILTWRIPWTEEPGGLQSVESQGIGHICRLWGHTESDTTEVT